MAAIYQWLVGGYVVQTLTTTLYPIEVFDSLTFSGNISVESSMTPIPSDELDVAADILSVIMTEILLEYGPVDEDEVDISADILSVILTTILLEYGPIDDDEVDIGADILEVVLAIRRVEIDTPDEKLQLSCNIRASGSSMTPV